MRSSGSAWRRGSLRRLGQKTPGVVAVLDAGEDRGGGPVHRDGARARQVAASAAGRARDHPRRRARVAARQLGERCRRRTASASCAGTSSRRTSFSWRSDGHLCAKITDFGIAKWVGQDRPADFRRRTADGVVLGTPAYLQTRSTRVMAWAARSSTCGRSRSSRTRR